MTIHEIIAKRLSTVVTDPEALATAMALARGSYQRDVLLGRHSLSGATLRGKAAQYGGHYARSRASLLARLDDAGVAWSEVTGQHGRRILVLGEISDAAAGETTVLQRGWRAVVVRPRIVVAEEGGAR